MITLTSSENVTLRVCVLRGELTTIRVQGELDFTSAGVLEEAAALVPVGAARVTVDLTDLTFVDGTGADSLAALHAAQVIRGRQVRLANARRHVRRIFAILRMESLLSAPWPQEPSPAGHQQVEPDWLRTTPLPVSSRRGPTPPMR